VASNLLQLAGLLYFICTLILFWCIVNFIYIHYF